MARGRGGSRGGFSRRSGSSSHRRRGPSLGMIELATMPPSGPYGFFFPYENAARRFNFMTFNPAFCDGKVTIDELEAVNRDIAAVPLPDIGCCPVRSLLGLLSFFVTAAVCGGTGGYFAAGQVINPSYSYFRSSKDTPQYFYKNLQPADVAVIIPISAILGIGLTCYLCCTGSSQMFAIAAEYMNKINQIFVTHQQTTFGPKDMTLRLSPHRTYLSVEFNWKAQELQVAKMTALHNYAMASAGGSAMLGGGQMMAMPGQQPMMIDPTTGMPLQIQMPGSIGYNQPPTNQFQPMSMAPAQQNQFSNAPPVF